MEMSLIIIICYQNLFIMNKEIEMDLSRNSSFMEKEGDIMSTEFYMSSSVIVGAGSKQVNGYLSKNKQSGSKNKINFLMRKEQVIKKRERRGSKRNIDNIIRKSKQSVRQIEAVNQVSDFKGEIKSFHETKETGSHQKNKISRNLSRWKNSQYPHGHHAHSETSQIIQKNGKLTPNPKGQIIVKQRYAEREEFLQLKPIEKIQWLNDSKQKKVSNICYRTRQPELRSPQKISSRNKPRPVSITKNRSAIRAVVERVKKQQESQIEIGKEDSKKKELILPFKKIKDASPYQMYEASNKKISVQQNTKIAPTFHGNYVNSLIKKHKADNIRQIQKRLRSTMSRAFGDFQRLLSVKQYNKKCGYQEDTKIFIFNSEDEYMRKILLSMGWVQNPSVESPFYHFKWTHMPVQLQITNQIQNIQLQNHFKNSHELTSKSYLTKNLKNSQYFAGKCQHYYPQCFDIGNSTQSQQFIEQYRHTIMINLLKKAYLHCRLHASEQVEKYSNFYRYHYSKDLYSADPVTYRKYKKSSCYRVNKDEPGKGFRKIDLQNYRNPNKDFQLNMNLIFEAIKYWRNFRIKNQELSHTYFQEGNTKEAYRATKLKKSSPLKNREKKQKVNENHALAFNKLQFMDYYRYLSIYSNTDVGMPIPQQKSFEKEMYVTPSQLLIERICKQYQFIAALGGLIPSYGTKNIWIVKPSSTSRGTGIFLTTNLNHILSSSKNVQSRIVQKYIEHPLIIRNQQYEKIYNRKFDIRQWVLIKSLQPLEIYMFSHCYLRLCYNSYPDLYNSKEDLNLSDYTKHLTNYSVNKHKYTNLEESVLKIDYLESILNEQYGVQWESIREKIKDIIINSISSCRESLEENRNMNSSSNEETQGQRSFQLLGYDILIDDQFNPWLLEVNMSPACQERTKWLGQYLDIMGKGLLDLVLPKQYKQKAQKAQPSFKDEYPNKDTLDQIYESIHNEDMNYMSIAQLFEEIEEEIPEQKSKKQLKWELIYSEESWKKRIENTQLKLEVVGNQIKLEDQRNVDFTLEADRAARLIQRFMRKHVPKYVQYKQSKFRHFQTIANYIKGFHELQKHKENIHNFYIKVIKKSLVTLSISINYEKIRKITAINQLSKYLHGTTEWGCYYPQKLDQYKKMVIIQQFNALNYQLKVNRQAGVFCYELIQKDKQIRLVQIKLRQFLMKRQYKIKVIQKYLRNFGQICYRYPNATKSVRTKQNILTIKIYMESFLARLKYQEKLEQHSIGRIQKMTLGLVSRRQWFQRRLEMFIYTVGRIHRVKKRKIRGQIFMVWKKQMILQQRKYYTNKVAQYFKTFFMMTAYQRKRKSSLA